MTARKKTAKLKKRKLTIDLAKGKDRTGVTLVKVRKDNRNTRIRKAAKALKEAAPDRGFVTEDDESVYYDIQPSRDLSLPSSEIEKAAANFRLKNPEVGPMCGMADATPDDSGSGCGCDDFDSVGCEDLGVAPYDDGGDEFVDHDRAYTELMNRYGVLKESLWETLTWLHNRHTLIGWDVDFYICPNHLCRRLLSVLVAD